VKRLSLSGKILLAACINAILLAALLVTSGAVPFALDVQAFVMGATGGAVNDVARRIAADLARIPPGEFGAALERYSKEFGVTFVVWHNDGFRVAGPDLALPPEVLDEVMGRRRPPGPGGPRKKGGPKRGPPPGKGPRAGGPGELSDGRVILPGTPPFLMRTSGTPRYWISARIPLPNPENSDPLRGTLLIASNTFFENPFLRGSLRWLLVALAAVAISIVCWAPLLRGVTRAIRQLELATARISDGRFDARVDERRGDELGRLGQSINRMAARIDALVSGQTRFLGDTAHELRSPLGRMRVALGLLDERVAQREQAYVRDLHDDVDELSSLTDKLLEFARARLAPRTDRPRDVSLKERVDRLIKAESRSGADVRVEVPPELFVRVYPEDIDRALGNVLRNAVRYAGQDGPITVRAAQHDGMVEIAVADCGPGVPPDAVERLFTPFYRLESSRDRKTGGVGLGLAIARSSVEACGGRIVCRNREPHGLEISMTVPAASPA
jgi:two-component system sensor histidine kinase CpxA